MQILQDLNSGPTSYIHTTHIINALFVKNDDLSVVSWIQEITYILLDFILQSKLFHKTTLWIPCTHLPTSLKYFCLNIISHYLSTSWKIYMQLSHTTNFVECISAHRYSFHIHQKSEKTGLYPHQPAHLHSTLDISMDYFQCFDVSLTHHHHSKGLLLHEISLDSAGCEDHNPFITLTLAVLEP